MSGIENNENALLVRRKLNSVLTREVESVSALVANTELTYLTGRTGFAVSGDKVRTRAENFSYMVVASDADYDLQTSGGLRLVVLPNSSGEYNFAAMAPAANGVTDDYPKLAKLLAKTIPGSSRGATIYFPTAVYFIGQTIDLKREVTLKGDAQGYFSQNTARLLFPPNTTGIVVNRANTLSTGIESPATTGADHSVISGVFIQSQGGTDRTKHGIWLRARANLHAVLVANFPGNGGHIVASFNGGEMSLGNANSWYMEMCGFQVNKNHGLYVDGADSNAGVAVCCDFSLNGRFGCYDSSFLGNAYLGCHAATNGLRGKGGNTEQQSSVVTYGGNRYCAHWTASESALVATEPGTNESVWRFYSVGGESDNYPVWQSGMPEGTYFRAFGYYSDSLTASNMFFNCYSEGDAPSALLGPAVQVGSMMEGLIVGAVLRSNGSSALLCNSIEANSGNYKSSLSDGSGFTRMEHPDVNGVWRLQQQQGDLIFRNNNADSNVGFYVTGNNKTVPCAIGNEKILVGTRAANMTIQSATTIPSNSEGRSGDLRINRSPARGGPGAWQKSSDGSWQVAWTLP
jgi:hypothetical protein